MKNVVFVAPLFRETTNRYVRAFADLPGVRLGVISQEPAVMIPKDLRDRVHAHYQVANAMEGADIGHACKALQRSMGPIDALLGALEQLTIPLAQARAMAGIPGMSIAVAQNFRDKATMKDVLRNAGVPVARHQRVTSAADLWSFVAEVGFPVVVKPPDGLGAAATWRLESPEDANAALSRFQPSPSDPFQAEEFVVGQENTCETVTIRGQPVWHSGTHYLPGPLEVLENPWMQYCVLLPREADDPDFTSFHPVNTAALSALGMQTGLSHMEWFFRKGGKSVVSEVGARPPGAMIMPLMQHAHQVDMVARWAELMVFERFDPPTRKLAAGVAFFRGQGLGRVVALHGLDKAQEEVGSLVVDRKLPVIGQPKASGYEGEGWAIVRHERTDVVKDALKKLISTVRVELG